MTAWWIEISVAMLLVRTSKSIAMETACLGMSVHFDRSVDINTSIPRAVKKMFYIWKQNIQFRDSDPKIHIPQGLRETSWRPERFGVFIFLKVLHCRHKLLLVIRGFRFPDKARRRMVLHGYVTKNGYSSRESAILLPERCYKACDNSADETSMEIRTF
jgi:hypothetical protein